uniref:Cyclin n=1 Tax=Amorphochlora amoebiformis TaxID=1561963 RepID=A0A7S0GTG5_9EUKA
MSIEESNISFVCGDFPIESVTSAVGCILAQVCAANEKLLLTRIPPKSRFQATNRPQISIEGYVSRIAKYSQCNAQSFILALIYIDRLIQRNPSFLITSLNAHRLFITAIVAAAKFSSDFFFKNSFYAKVGGISTAELNELELEFLFRTHFDLFVKKDTFNQYHAHLMTYSNNSSRMPRQLQLEPAVQIKKSNPPGQQPVSRPNTCQAEHFSRLGTDSIECGVYSVHNSNIGNRRPRCPQLFSRPHYRHSASNTTHQTHQTPHNHHNQLHRAKTEPIHHHHHRHYKNLSPYAKRHRSMEKPVTISMDIWFPAGATVAAR